MRFVIVGGGRVGSRTARVLQEEGHVVSVIEQDDEAIDRLQTEGIPVITGDGARESVLQDAGIAQADALAALTGDLNANFAACMIAKHHGCRTVMRIDEDYREDMYRRYASDVDEIIYPERLGAMVAKNALLGGNIRAIADIAQNLQVVELTVTARSPMHGYSMEEIQLPADATILAMAKGDDPFDVPQADQTLSINDRLVVLADFDVLDDVRQLVVGPADQAVIGGG